MLYCTVLYCTVLHTTNLSSLVVDGEAAEEPGRHARLGSDVVPAHGLRGREPLVPVTLHCQVLGQQGEQDQTHSRHLTGPLKQELGQYSDQC